MRIDHVPCGEFANDSERVALETLLVKLKGASRQSPLVAAIQCSQRRKCNGDSRRDRFNRYRHARAVRH